MLFRSIDKSKTAFDVFDALCGIITHDELHGIGIVGIDPIGHLLLARPAFVARVRSFEQAEVAIELGAIADKAFVADKSICTNVFFYQSIPDLMGDWAGVGIAFYGAAIGTSEPYQTCSQNGEGNQDCLFHILNCFECGWLKRGRELKSAAYRRLNIYEISIVLVFKTSAWIYRTA